jgi:hypothetical protein
MEYLPPGRVQRIGDKQFPRYVIRDGLGQYFARNHWSDNPSDAVLFYREIDAVKERNRCCLGGDTADTFTVMAILTVHAGRWSRKTLAALLKRHREFAIAGPAGKKGLLLEILYNTLKKVER